MPAFEIQVVGLPKILQRIQRLIVNGDWSPAPRAAGEYMRKSIARNFSEEGRPTVWIQSRRARLVGGQTLTDTGTLAAAIATGQSASGKSTFYATDYPDTSRPSIYERVRPGASLHVARGIFRVTNAMVQLGVASRYGRPTHFGFVSRPTALLRSTRGMPIYVPPRPFLMFQREDITIIVNNWLRWAARSFSLAETGGQ